MSKINKEKLYLHVEVPCVEHELTSEGNGMTKARYFAKVYPQEFPNRRVIRVLSHLLAESNKKCNEVFKDLKYSSDTRGYYFGWAEDVIVRNHEDDEYNEEVGKKVVLAKVEVKSLEVYRRLIDQMYEIGRNALLDLQHKNHKSSREIAKQKEYIKKSF